MDDAEKRALELTASIVGLEIKIATAPTMPSTVITDSGGVTWLTRAIAAAIREAVADSENRAANFEMKCYHLAEREQARRMESEAETEGD